MDKSQQKEYYEKQFLDRYDGLNEKQKEAVDNIEGPVLVIAGPGSGKTELLSVRTANILRLSDVSASNILLLTFTDSGAKNMRERIVGLIGEDGYKVGVYTFHAFASDMMGKFPEYFFDGASFRPATDIERYGIVEDIISNMSYDNPLNTRHPSKGYVYTNDILNIIAGLKKHNFTGEDFKNFILNNVAELEQIQEVCTPELENLAVLSAKKAIPEYAKICEKLEVLSNSIFEKGDRQNFNSSAKYLFDTLSLAILESNQTGKTTFLTNWRKKVLEKNTSKNIVSPSYTFIDLNQKRVKKWLAVADAYEEYSRIMYEKAVYDFDDMIFMVSRELKRNPHLRNILEEQYQYIMVDEFQDTSDTQFEFIKNLTSSSVNEGRPNILAVGDDDQAIFKFQGAKLDNVTKFKNSFKDVHVITLDKNYRSTQNILDTAKNAIELVETRLEKIYPEINKNLKASNPKITEKFEGKVILKGFENQILEEEFVAKEIESLVKKGVTPREISVISKSHKNLASLAGVLNAYKIPYSYEKKENVLTKEHVIQIINIVLFVQSALDNPREELLPEILSYDFFGVSRLKIWELANKVKDGNKYKNDDGQEIYEKGSWLKTMMESDDKKIKQIGEFLMELAVDAKSMPLTHLIDKIIGTSEYELDQGVDDSDEVLKKEIATKSGYVSPFREFYFGSKNFKVDRTKYLEFLFSLRTFISALKEFKIGEVLYAKDIEEFLKIYENNPKLKLNLVSPFATSNEAIVLQTAHKAKGLEYEYVFLINSDRSEWLGKGKGSSIASPFNLKLLNDKDNIDDKIRLYYVAMTRAKHTLYLTYHEEPFEAIIHEVRNEKIKNELDNKTETTEKPHGVTDVNERILFAKYIVPPPEIVEEEKILLKRLLEKYQMPVTHLINYIDFSKVGPQRFIEQNLLRFPQAMSPSSAYGTAIHEAMQLYYQKFNRNGVYPTTEDTISYFRNSLNRQSLSEKDFKKYLEKGATTLTKYLLDLSKRRENGLVKVEVNFKNEGVNLGGANLTGKIDKMWINKNDVVLTDLKTGGTFDSWSDKGLSNYDKLKLHFFKYQLAFYKILLNKSHSYHHLNIVSANIEFVEPEKDTGKINILNLDIDDELLDRVENLTKVVYKKVMDLDFVNIDKYLWDEKNKKIKDVQNITLNDIVNFENDLLNGKI